MVSLGIAFINYEPVINTISNSSIAMNHPLPITEDLAQVFPDIEG